MTTFVSYHTGPGYAVLAQRLVASLDALGLAHDVRAIKDAGTWLANCAHKSAFLRAIRGEIAGPLVWLDADAIVMHEPAMFDALPARQIDLAYHRFRGREVCTGTLWVGDTPGARTLLDAWCDAQTPSMWDQRALQTVLDAQPERWRIAQLPESYLAIDGLMSRDVDPIVIRHTQASRTLKVRL